jgi:diamine N-acetyltransferase
MAEAVTLRAITDHNRPEALELRVAAAQEGFVDGVARSLGDAAEHPELVPWPRAVYAGERPVGFVMLADGVAEGNPDVPWPGARPPAG